MAIKAVFENIQTAISNELTNAEHSISVAVAWFTDQELIDILTVKANQGVRVSVVISNIVLNNKPELAFKRLVEEGGCIFLVGDETRLMHHKFCVVDYKTVLTGSYNWSNQAHGNLENLVVISDYETAVEYTKCFDRLLTEVSIEKLGVSESNILKNKSTLIVAKAEALQNLGLDVNIEAMAATL